MKPIYLLAFLLFIAGAGQAQQKRDTIHHASSEKKKLKMKDELKLDKKQAAEIKASKKEYKAAKAKVDSDTKLTEDQKKAKIKELKAEKKKKTDATLTPQQKEKAKALKAEKKKEKKAEKS